eukprot:1800431-Pleurochrysis_carterae.AAC.6
MRTSTSDHLPRASSTRSMYSLRSTDSSAGGAHSAASKRRHAQRACTRSRLQSRLRDADAPINHACLARSRRVAGQVHGRRCRLLARASSGICMFARSAHKHAHHAAACWVDDPTFESGVQDSRSRHDGRIRTRRQRRCR